MLADISTPEVRGRMIAIYQGTFIFSVGIGPFPGGLLAEHFGLAAPFVFTGLGAFLATVVAWFAVRETREMARAPRRAEAPTPLLPCPDPHADAAHRLCAREFDLAHECRGAHRRPLRHHSRILATARLGLSVTAIGFALMLGSISGLFASYPAGWLADRYGRKTVIVPVTLISGISMVLFCFAPSYAWFIVACLVWGVAIAAGGAAPAAYAADTAPPGMNAAAMSTFRMTGDSGYVIGPLALGFIADLYGPVVALLSGAAGSDPDRRGLRRRSHQTHSRPHPP